MAKATEAERALVLAEGTKRGWPAAELDAAISIESGWDAGAHNSIKAGGLIGFLPGELRKLGWNAGPEAFWRLTAAEQAPYVGRYLDGVKRPWRVAGDTYMALAAPSFIGASDSTVVYPYDPSPRSAWTLNRGWRPASGGDITAGSIRAVLLRRMNRGPMRLPQNSYAAGWGALMTLAAVYLLRKYMP